MASKLIGPVAVAFLLAACGVFGEPRSPAEVARDTAKAHATACDVCPGLARNEKERKACALACAVRCE
jgi:hypothetical protein